MRGRWCTWLHNADVSGEGIRASWQPIGNSFVWHSITLATLGVAWGGVQIRMLPTEARPSAPQPVLMLLNHHFLRAEHTFFA